MLIFERHTLIEFFITAHFNKASNRGLLIGAKTKKDGSFLRLRWWMEREVIFETTALLQAQPRIRLDVSNRLSPQTKKWNINLSQQLFMQCPLG